ncbi:MAG: helix-turn-helix domain-containing protein [Oscillospiraceae bacterium]|nr:helix-turn-helix domain-containing protein [Oscillospiraceae bacterium]
MLYVEMLLGGLHENVKANRCREAVLSNIRGVLYFDPGFCSSLSGDYLYVCAAGDMEKIREIYADDVFIFCSAENGGQDLDDTAFPWCERLVVLDLPAFRIINTLTMKLNEYKEWLLELRSTEDIQKVTEIAVAKFKFPAAVLNSFFFPNAISYDVPPQSEVFRILAENERIPSSQAAPILSVERDNLRDSSISFLDGGVRITDYPIRYNNRVIARIFVEDHANDSPTAKYYLEDYIDTIRPFLEARDSLKKSSMNAISTLIADVINRVLTNAEQIEEYRMIIPDLVQGKYYSPVVITFTHPGREIPYNYISGQLEMIFPHCSVATYNSGLIVIVPKETLTEKIRFDHKYLTELLTSFDAYAGIGNSTQYLTALRPLYIEAAATTRLGRVFCADKRERIFRYEDYCMYFMVDLCIEAAVRQHMIANISYLCDPGLLKIIRYDREKETSLYETLKTYIECGNNVSLCAQKMFSHRNTVNYRIKLIEDILGTPLRDASLIQKLSFSIMIVEYETDYLKCDPLDASGKLSVDVDWDSYTSLSEKPYY